MKDELTRFYNPPEESRSIASDVYGIGLICFEILILGSAYWQITQQIQTPTTTTLLETQSHEQHHQSTSKSDGMETSNNNSIQKFKPVNPIISRLSSQTNLPVLPLSPSLLTPSSPSKKQSMFYSPFANLVGEMISITEPNSEKRAILDCLLDCANVQPRKRLKINELKKNLLSIMK